MKDYYAILEVPAKCGVLELREAYRRLIQSTMWEKESFTEVQHAYAVLNDPEQRSQYDQALFGKGFANTEAVTDTTKMTNQSSTTPSNAPRHCPMGAAAQCPIVNSRVALSETYCPECGFLIANLSMEGFVATSQVGNQPHLEEETGRMHPLYPGINNVGRDSADVILPDKTVSRLHARLELKDEMTVFVEDMGSTNGTQVNGESLMPNFPRRIVDGDTVRFGSIRLSLRLPAQILQEELDDLESPFISEPVIIEPAPIISNKPGAAPIKLRAQLVDTSDGVSGQEIPVVPGVTTFGRRPENTIVLTNNPFVSGNHAQIIAEENTFRLTDIGSTNGTLLNGKRLTPNEPAMLAPGDTIAIGDNSFRFEIVPDTSDEG